MTPAEKEKEQERRWRELVKRLPKLRKLFDGLTEAEVRQLVAAATAPERREGTADHE